MQDTRKQRGSRKPTAQIDPLLYTMLPVVAASMCNSANKRATELMAVPVYCRLGEDHRSLPDVLTDLQGQLSGQEPKLTPGQAQSRPLHVVLQVISPCCHHSLSLCCCTSGYQHTRNLSTSVICMCPVNLPSMLCCCE